MKDTLRKIMLEKRNSVKFKKEKEQRIIEKILDIEEFKNSRNIALYYPIRNEVNVLSLMEHIKSDKKSIYMPKIKGNKLIFCKITGLDDLIDGKWGLKEPSSDTDRFEEIEVFIVPTVCVDRRGYRIGYGKGFYDRTIQRALPFQCFISVCFDFQIVDYIKTDPWDHRVDIIVSESFIIHCVTQNLLKGGTS